MSLYNPTKMVRHTSARAEDVNRELDKVKAAIDQLQAALENISVGPEPEPIPLYTWNAYANSADGTVDFTTGAPGDRSYIGFAFNKLTPTPSEFPEDYKWSLIQGAIGELVSFDTNNVAGRPAAQLIMDLDLLALSLMAYQFDRQALRDYVDARLYVDGQPVNAVIVSEKNIRMTADSALAETISLIGSVAPGGESFIVDLNKTYVDASTSLGVKLTAMQAATSTAQASLQELAQTVAEANYASATDLALLGAKTLDGTAWVLDMATVKVSPTETIGQYINTAVAAAAGEAASVTEIYEAVITPTGGASAKAVLQLDVNGKVVGHAATNDGTTGQIVFKYDSFIIEDPDGTALFTAEGGVVKMPNVEVGRIKAGVIDTAQLVENAGAAPVIVSASAFVLGGGIGVLKQIVSANVTLKRPAMIYAMASVAQGFTSGPRMWREHLSIGGANVFSAGGGLQMDSISLSGARYLSAGTYTVEVNMEGQDSSVRAMDRTLFVMVIY